MSGISSSSVPAQRRSILMDLPKQVSRGQRDGIAFNGKSSLFSDPYQKWEPTTGGAAVEPGGSLDVCFNRKGIPVSNTGIKSAIKTEFGAEGGLNEVVYPVHIDWLTFTLNGFYLDYDINRARKWIENWSHDLLTIGGTLERRYNGYRECWQIIFADGGDSGGVSLGWVGVSHKSDHQRGWWCFSLPGSVSSLIDDWGTLVRSAVSMKSRITRCDIALDDVNGDHPLSEALDMYKSGAFSTGGRSPNCETITNSRKIGNTIKIGCRDSGKMLRVYEKGLHLMAGKRFLEAPSSWVRYEIEMLRKNGRVLPWDMLLKPAEYLKGAYPDALHWMKCSVMSISIIKEKAKLSLVRLFEHGRQQVGRLVNYCRDYLQLDDCFVLDGLAGNPGRYPASLVDTMQVGCLPFPDFDCPPFKLHSC